MLCGGHHASSCENCPQGKGEKWCNGDCLWDNRISVCYNPNQGTYIFLYQAKIPTIYTLHYYYHLCSNKISLLSKIYPIIIGLISDQLDDGLFMQKTKDHANLWKHNVNKIYLLNVCVQTHFNSY